MMIVFLAAPVLSYALVVALCIGLLGWRNHRAIALLALSAALVTLFALMETANARDNGRFAGADPEIKAWFDHLASGKGLCCSIADGERVDDVDWETHDGHYRVRLDGEWYDVPDDAVITVPNRVGRTMVWPIRIPGQVIIRCFMPGAMI